VLEAGLCILAALVTCPADKVMYSPVKSGSMCETPFACIAGFRTTGTKVDQSCKCVDRGFCRDCDWGLQGHQCTSCKKFSVLHAGKCITQLDCVTKGGMPLLADGSRGGICKV
jgi:hypothetical protein